MLFSKCVVLAFLAGPPLLLSAYAVDASAIYGVNHTHWAVSYTHLTLPTTPYV